MDDLKTLTRWIDADPALAGLRDICAGLLDDDPGHDLGHALRVALWTIRIGGLAVDARCAVAAALLHDVVNVPKDSSERARASELSAARARAILPEHGFEPEKVAAVADAIRDHSFSRGATPETDLGRALQDADRLEALGALGVMRTVACGVRMGARFFDPSDPWALARPLDDRVNTLDHFFQKLLRLPETMNTEPGRCEARRRVAFMRDFVHQLGTELGTEFKSPNGA